MRARVASRTRAPRLPLIAASGACACDARLPRPRPLLPLAGEALEYGVVLATKTGDGAAFERAVAMLKPFYAASRCARRRAMRFA